MAPTNFVFARVGNVALLRWTGDATPADVDALFARLRRARDEVAGAPLVGVAVVARGVRPPTGAAKAAMDARREELLRLLDVLFYVVETDAIRTQKVASFFANFVATIGGRRVRLARSVRAALADARVRLLVPAEAVVAHGRRAGLVGETDPPPGP